MGVSLKELKRKEEAEQCFAQVVRLRPNCALSLGNLAGDYLSCAYAVMTTDHKHMAFRCQLVNKSVVNKQCMSMSTVDDIGDQKAATQRFSEAVLKSQQKSCSVFHLAANDCSVSISAKAACRPA